MARIIFFDLETRKHARDLNPEDEQAGWDALRRGDGGVSALAIFDTLDNWLYVYDDNSIQAAARHIEAADAVVGYCSERFDVPVVEGLIGRRLSLRCHYDIYTELAKENARRGIRTQRGDLTLDAVSKRNLGRGKIEHGSSAKALAIAGRFGELFNYCISDVHLTYDLFRHICTVDGVNNLNGGFLPLVVPDWLKVGMAKE